MAILKIRPPQTTAFYATWPFVTLGLAVFLTFGRCVFFSFVEYDDHLHIYENPRLVAWTWQNLTSIWTKTYFRLYIPITETFWALLAEIARIPGQTFNISTGQYGYRAGLFHAANLVLHGLNAGLVFSILKCVGKPAWAAWFGAILFALHPLQVEPVAWISGGRDLLQAFWLLLALRCMFYRRSDVWLVAIGCLAFFLLAMLSKPSAAGFPLILLGVIKLTESPANSTKEPAAINFSVLKRRAVIVILGSLIISAPLIFMAQQLQPRSIIYDTVAFPMRILIAGYSLWFYLRTWILPIGLSPFYGLNPVYLTQDTTSIAFAIFAWCLIAGAPLISKKYRQHVLGVLAIYIGALLPVLGFIEFEHQNLSQVVDRYAYVATLAPSWLVTTMMTWLAKRKTRLSRIIAAIGVTSALLLLTMKSFMQAGLWRDSLTLYQGGLERANRPHPASHQLYYGYGAALFKRHADRAAEEAFREALKREPRDAQTHFDLGLVLARLGRREEGLTAYLEALRNNPSMAQALVNVAVHYIGDRRFTEGLDLLDRAIAVSPTSVLAHYNRGIALTHLQRWEEAMISFSESARLNPQFVPAYEHLALIHQHLGRHEDAAQALKHIERFQQK